LIDRVEKLEASAAAREDRDHQHQLSLDQLRIQPQEMFQKDQKIKQLEKHNKKLQRMLDVAQQGSPESPIHREPLSRPGGEDVNEAVIYPVGWSSEHC
jgi:cell shape-determining protein MreC